METRAEESVTGVATNLGSLMLTVRVEAREDGKDHVSCFTMSGDIVFSKAYGYFERCIIIEYRELVKQALGGSPRTNVEFVMGEKKLRGNAILSRGPKSRPTLGDRIWRTVHVRQHFIHRYFKRIYSNDTAAAHAACK